MEKENEEEEEEDKLKIPLLNSKRSDDIDWGKKEVKIEGGPFLYSWNYETNSASKSSIYYILQLNLRGKKKKKTKLNTNSAVLIYNQVQV